MQASRSQMTAIADFLMLILLLNCTAGDDNFGFRTQSQTEQLRKSVLEKEADWRFGSQQKLTPDDEILNEIYKKHKTKLLQSGYEDESRFRPSKFFLDKHFMQEPRNKVYEIVKRLPKGALLHVHQSATANLSTYPHILFSAENCKICENGAGQVKLTFYDDGVKELGGTYKCRKCPKVGDKYYQSEIDLIVKLVTMFDGVDYSEATVQLIWENFEKKFGPTSLAMDTWHVWKLLLDSVLDFLVADNVQYVEFRGGCDDIYDKNGTKVPFREMMKYMEERIKLVRKEKPNFCGVNLICTAYRVQISDDRLLEELKSANEFALETRFVRGFDLVGWEDGGRTLKSCAPVMQKFREETGNTLPFVFHAGETLWAGFGVDENVLDAVLLGTKRIGHGYALDSHPYVIEMMRAETIGVELNPLSNQILGLVDDVRNHRNKHLMDVANKPGLLSNNSLKFSVNSDDCLIFGSRPMTDDLYSAALALTSKDSDLRVIKQFAYDSIETSLLNEDEKKELTAIFEAEWNRVVKSLISELTDDDSSDEIDYYYPILDVDVKTTSLVSLSKKRYCYLWLYHVLFIALNLFMVH